MLKTEPQDAGASHREQVAVLSEASALLLSGFGERDVAERIVDLTTRLVRADAYALWRFEARTNRWNIIAARGLSPEFLRSSSSVLPSNAAGLANDTFVARTDDPIFAPRKAMLESERIQSLAGAPIRIGDTPIGSVVCYFRREASLTPDDLRAFTSLGNLAAVALGGAALRDDQEITLGNLARSERRYHSLASSSPTPQAIWTLTPDGRVEEDSPSWRALTGQTPEEWRSGWYEVVHPLDRARVNEILRNAVREKTPATSDYRLRMADGSYRWVRSKVVPIYDAANELTEWIGTTVDVETARDAEHKLAESAERYRQLADAMPQIVWTARPDGLTDYFNERWYEYTAMSRADTDGSNWLSVVHPDDRERCQRTWSHSVATGEKYEVEYRLRSGRTGEYRWFLGRALPARDSLGRVVRWFGSCTDIDDQKRTQEALRSREQAIETVLRLSRDVSAELKLDRLVQIVTDAATELTRAQFGAFFYNVVDSHGESYTLYTISGVPREAFSRFPMPRNTPVFEPTFSGRGVVRSGDIRKDPRYGKNPPVNGMPAGHLPVVSYLAVPVVSRSGEVLGGLFFGHKDPDVFTAEDERIVVGLAAQAAVGIDNARLFEAAAINERRYRSLVTAAPTAVTIWVANPEGDLVEPSISWQNATGQSFAQMRGAGWLDAIHPNDRERARAAWREAVATTTMFRAEYRLQMADGEYRWFAAKGVPVLNEDQTVREWVGTTADVHDQKEIEESAAFINEASILLSSSLDYETTLRALAKLVVPRLSHCCSIEISLAGEAYRRLAVEHIDPSKIPQINRATEHFRPPADRDPVALAIGSGEPQLITDASDDLIRSLAVNDEHLELLKGLELRSWMVVPMTARGRRLGAISFLSSGSGKRFTERDVPVAEELARRAAVAIDNARLYRDAEEANRTKDQFLATLSHELRTPLTAILGWARMLRIEQLEPALVEEALTSIDKSAQAQAQLIDDLLDVSRITAGKLYLNIGEIDLQTIVRAAIDTVRPAASARNIKLQTEFDKTPVRMKADGHRLQQVVWNLLANAIKFTPPGGTVTTRLHRDGEGARLDVIDTGKGIAPEFLPHMFERFRQADSTTTRMYGGLGLGLSIVKHIVELHGGTISASSDGHGKGSTFTVALPLLGPGVAEPVPEKAPEPPSPALALPDLSGVSVLVVDDDPNASRFVAAVLEKAGAAVTVKDAVTEAVQSLGRHVPDVLISDIAMPDEDGFALIVRARNIARISSERMPAIALTAFGRVEDRVQILGAGFQRYLMKPVDPVELAAMVREVLQTR